MTEMAVRESPIAGLGVFTLESLQTGQELCEFRLEREMTPEAPLQPDHGELPEHCAVIDGRVFLVCAPERHLNHSCDPNSYLRFSEDGIHVVTRRDVAADCEITIDYLMNNDGGDSWRCSCGAARCRGETGHSFFTLPEELQREYYPFLAPWFFRRYEHKLQHLDKPSPTTSQRSG